MASTTDHTTRLSSYKNKAPDIEDIRRQHVETSVEIRKQMKEKILLKYRKMDESKNGSGSRHKKHSKSHTKTINKIASDFKSSDYTTLLQATESLARLSGQKNPPYKYLIELGLVNTLVSFLQQDDRPVLQALAAWALINFASETTEETQVVVRAGAVPHLIRLLQAQDMGLVENCTWALGNIAGSGAELRNLMIEEGIIEPLIDLVDMSAPPTFLRVISWTLCNLFRHKNPPSDMKSVQATLPALSVLLQHSDKEVLDNTCWAFVFISDIANSQIQQVIDAPGVLTKLMELLDNTDAAIVSSALVAVSTIAAGDDCHTQAVLDEGILKILPKLLENRTGRIKEDACWMLSNITAGSVQQIQQVIDHNLLPIIIQVLSMGNFKSQKQAAWAIVNLTSRGTILQISLVVQCGAFSLMCELLVSSDTELLLLLLDGIMNILEAVDKINQTKLNWMMIKEFGGQDKLKQLQNHENVEVCNRANKIVEKYFSKQGHP